MANELIGKYRVLNEIASGGQGAVFRAFDPSTGMIVAIKVLHAQYASNKSFVERFHREASLIQKIDHEIVVKIFDVDESDGRHFIVLEFIPESLSGLIEVTGALSYERASAITIGISEGIGQAHKQGIIHRDIKPQNVLLTPAGVPKMTFTPKTVPYEVLDFWDDFGPTRKGSSNEEIKVYGRTDLLRPQAGGERHASEWCVPENGHIGEYVLPMEKKVRRHGSC